MKVEGPTGLKYVSLAFALIAFCGTLLPVFDESSDAWWSKLLTYFLVAVVFHRVFFGSNLVRKIAYVFAIAWGGLGFYGVYLGSIKYSNISLTFYTLESLTYLCIGVYLLVLGKHEFFKQ